jgi:histidinol-phosphate aminotransferase
MMTRQPIRKQILLDRNENHYGPAPACLETLRSIESELLFDYPRDFKHGYYSALSLRLAEIHGVDENRIILGYGCEDILKQAVHHALRPGERCFIPSASWWYYRAIADEVEGVTIEYPIIESPTTYQFDVDALKALHQKTSARIVLISSPNNPTGNIFPTARLAETIEHFRSAMVVLDEAYFGLGDGPSFDAASLTNEYPNLLVLRTFSKLYGLAGVRIGYGIAGTGLSRFLKFTARSLGYSRISERLALAALDNPAYYDEIRRKMAWDRKRICESLRRFDGVRAYDSQANFVLCRFPSHIIEPLKSALEARGLFIKFFTEPAFVSSARITLGTQEEDSWLLESFQEILPELLRRCA